MILGYGGDHSDEATIQVRVNDDERVDPQGELSSYCDLHLSIPLLFLGIGFPAGFHSWSHWYEVIKAFCLLNPEWLKTENQDLWTAIHCCDARILAVQDSDYVRDSSRCVMNGQLIVTGTPPTPVWPFRGRFMQKKMKGFAGPGYHILPVIDVGLDTVSDHDWIRTGGLSQNEVHDESNQRLNYSLMFGVSAEIFNESTTDEEPSDTDDSCAREIIKYYTDKSSANAIAEIKVMRGKSEFWESAKLPSVGNPSLDAMFQSLNASIEFATSHFMKAAGKQRSATLDEKADSDLSLNASNNMDYDSSPR